MKQYIFLLLLTFGVIIIPSSSVAPCYAKDGKLLSDVFETDKRQEQLKLQESELLYYYDEDDSEVYVSETYADADAFVTGLKDNANLRWQICVEADEMICEANGNTVFFLMSPASLEQ